MNVRALAKLLSCRLNFSSLTITPTLLNILLTLLYLCHFLGLQCCCIRYLQLPKVDQQSSESPGRVAGRRHAILDNLHYKEKIIWAWRDLMLSPSVATVYAELLLLVSMVSAAHAETCTCTLIINSACDMRGLAWRCMMLIIPKSLNFYKDKYTRIIVAMLLYNRYTFTKDNYKNLVLK